MSNISGVTQSGNNVIIESKDFAAAKAQETAIEVKNGSVLSGRVMSITDTDGEKVANIDLGNATISAKLSEGMGLKEGQVLSFAVRGSGSNGITITPLLENTSIYQSTMKALSAAGLAINNESLQMVKEMMEAGLSIDKSSLLEMSKNLSTYSDTGVSTLVEMKSLGIPINQNNIEQYSSYKNYEHQVTMEMTSIIEDLPKAFDGLMNSGNNNAAINLYGQVLQLFAEGAEVNAQTQAIDNPQALSEANSQVQAEINPEALANENAEITANAEKIIGSDETILANVEEGANPVVNSALGKVSGEAGQESGQKISVLMQENVNEQRLDPKFSGFLDNLRNLNVSEKTIQDLIKETGTGNLDAQKALIKELASAFETTDLSNPVEMASWKKLFTSDEYNKMLKSTITDQWLLKPGDVEKKENIDSLYQRLGTQAKALAETITNTLGAESRLAQSANNLSNNLDFMNQLNQMFQYVQLPLQMTNQNANGDLYVYRNKNKKMSEDGSVSAILHLDMESLGPVDVYVKLKETKVTTNFYVADEEVLDLINDNIHILTERLEKRGYSMQVNMKLHDDKDGENDAVDELLAVNRTEIISTNSFDARA